MKINELEKYLVENEINENKFINFVEALKDNLEFNYNSTRRLTDEEIDYEIFNDSIMEFLEFVDSSNSSNEVEEHCHENCDCNHEHNHFHNHYHNLEDRFLKNMRFAHITALYLLREGIQYIDLVQDGLIGLVKANNLFESDVKFEKNKMYFIAKEMIEHIKSQIVYRKTAFKQYIEAEKEKEIKLKLNPKVRLKDRDEELKKAETLKKEEHRQEIVRLEEITKNMFDYSSLKYRLSIREIEMISLYFGFDGSGKKNFEEIQKILGLSIPEVEKLLREGIFKLSVVKERVEL